MCLAVALAVLPLRIKFYDFFLITHIVLVILALIGCWYHLVPHFGYTYGYQVWLYVCFAFWAFDRLVRLGRIVWFNILGNSTAVVESVPGCDILHVTVYPRIAWGLGPGQHTFLYFSGLGKFWENHPFSIAGWKRQGQLLHIVSDSTPSDSDVNRQEVDKSGAASSESCLDSQANSTARKEQYTLLHQNDGQDHTSIDFLIRPHSGMTSALQRHLSSTPTRTSMGMSVYTEGPYAGHRATLQSLSVADTVLCLVGGIGITHALGFVQEYKSANSQRAGTPGNSRGIMANAKRFIFAWSARETALIEFVKKRFLFEKDDVDGIEYSFWCTDSSDPFAQELEPLDGKSEGPNSLSPGTRGTVTAGRMDVRAVIRSSVEVGYQTTILMCGPGAMGDEATRHVTDCVKDGFRVELIAETYTW